MNNLATYLVQSGIALTVFYLFYWLFLRNDTHFRMNRAYLILTILISMIMPGTANLLVNTSKVLDNLSVISIDFNMPGSVVSANADVSSEVPTTLKLTNILFIIYITGACLVFARLIYQAIFLHALTRLSEKTSYKGFTIVSMNTEMIPFSYFKRIFIPTAKFEEGSFESIVTHEKSHLSQGHYIDLVLIEFISIFHWFNPAVWFYEKAIKELHEYLADEAVLSSGKNQGRYQALLVNQIMGGPVFIFTNQFNQSLIKKRITMMKKVKSPKLAKLKALLVLPLIAGLLLAFMNPDNSSLTSAGKREVTVTGKLSDKTTGSVLPGAFVVIKGTQTGTVSDKQGNYSILVDNEDAVLVYSMVGYKSQEIPIGNNAVINVMMDQEAMVIDFNQSPGTGMVKASPQAKTNDKEVYVVQEELPEYPGGMEALKNYLSSSLKYPEEARKSGIEGKVYVNFIVNAQGKILQPKIMRSASPLFNEEALRLVQTMPEWKPAHHNGEPLSMAITLPIEFRIE